MDARIKRELTVSIFIGYSEEKEAPRDTYLPNHVFQPSIDQDEWVEIENPLARPRDVIDL